MNKSGPSKIKAWGNTYLIQKLNKHNFKINILTHGIKIPLVYQEIEVIHIVV